MNRRTFLRALVAVPAAVAGLQLAPPPVTTAVDEQLGISIRFIRQWDATSRLDVFYGWPALQPELAWRVEG
jgi:hypothetical protein